jgi:ribonuclease VapC
MIVDSSAVIAVLKMEPDWLVFAEKLNPLNYPRMSAATYLEVCALVDGLRLPAISQQVDELIEECKIEIEPVTADQARIARQAYRDYGKGSGHPAQLNFGDCFSYALARVKRETILFKGTNFQQTDLRAALP